MEKKRECKTKVKENENYFLLCWQRRVIRREKQNHITWRYCHFFICSQCVFTTAARRVDNKFILNTKGKWCGAAQNLLQQIYITILWVFTFVAETGKACIITPCPNEGRVRKEAQIWSSHWHGEICVPTLSVLSDWDSYQVKHFFGFHQIRLRTPAPVPSAQRNKENCVAIVTLPSFQFGLRQHWHLVVAPRTSTWV